MRPNWGSVRGTESLPPGAITANNYSFNRMGERKDWRTMPDVGVQSPEFMHI